MHGGLTGDAGLMTPMTDNALQLLVDIGFEEVGTSKLSDNLLACKLNKHGSECEILYAFVSQREVLYIGKSVQTLKSRLYGYEKPGPTQNTNIAGKREAAEASGKCPCRSDVRARRERTGSLPGCARERRGRSRMSMII